MKLDNIWIAGQPPHLLAILALLREQPYFEAPILHLTFETIRQDDAWQQGERQFPNQVLTWLC